MIHKGTNILLLPEILEQISLNSGQKTVFIGRVHLLHSPRQSTLLPEWLMLTCCRLPGKYGFPASV